MRGGGGNNINNTFIKHGCFKLIKSDDINMYNVTKYFYLKINLEKLYSAVFNFIIIIIQFLFL